MELVEENLLTCTGMFTEDEQSGIVRLGHYIAQEYFRRTRAR